MDESGKQMHVLRDHHLPCVEQTEIHKKTEGGFLALQKLKPSVFFCQISPANYLTASAIKYSNPLTRRSNDEEDGLEYHGNHLAL